MGRWILIAFIVALGLIFVAAAWVLAGSDVPAERESNGQGIIASLIPTRVSSVPRTVSTSRREVLHMPEQRQIGEKYWGVCWKWGFIPFPCRKTRRA
jgi:hypothetical protein